MSANNPSAALEQQAQSLAGKVRGLRDTLSQTIIGQGQLIEDLTIGLLAGGHVLLEGLPGLGKTRLVNTLSHALGLQFSRIQFTPDLMPADVTGTRIVEEQGSGLEFRFQPGPLFANLILADEINRATPKTQSAMLEAMQEASVTVGDTTHKLPRPFTVIATQNPIELEGTFPLPEAQLDRFLFHLVVQRPGVDDMVAILDSTTGTATAPPEPVLSGEQVVELQRLVREILCGPHLLRWVAELVQATDPRSPDTDDDTKRLVRYGASPRAGQAIVLASKVRALLDGRPSVQQSDLEACILPALRHRVVLTFEAEAENRDVASLMPAWVAGATRRAK